MHAVRRELVEAQAERLGLPLRRVDVPSPCPNEVYEARMAAAVAAAAEDGVDRLIFGDLFLADVRAYRQRTLAGSGVAPCFPLWGRPTGQLATEMIGAGVRAVLTCVDPAQLPAEFIGRQFDADLIADLPDGVDPCGERSEFHTFVWDAPGFRSPIPIEVGEAVERGRVRVLRRATGRSRRRGRPSGRCSAGQPRGLGLRVSPGSVSVTGARSSSMRCLSCGSSRTPTAATLSRTCSGREAPMMAEATLSPPAAPRPGPGRPSTAPPRRRGGAAAAPARGPPCAAAPG